MRSVLTASLQIDDCSFVLPLPTTKRHYNAVARPGRFAGRWTLWERYAECVFDAVQHDSDELLLRRLLPMKRLASRTRFSFVGDASFSDFKAAIVSGKRVIALLTHCENEHELEFMDGFVDPERIASEIPEDFAGIIHFSSCKSKNLVPLVKKRARNCNVGWFPCDEGVQEWIDRHSAVFLLLASGKAGSYYEAWVEVEAWRSKTLWK